MEELNLANQSSQNQADAAQKAIDKALSTKCKNHPRRNAEFLHLLPNLENVKICINCIQQDKIPSENYLQIREVLTGSNDSDLFSYPILSDRQLQEAVLHNGEDLDSVKQKIDGFFQEITKLIELNLEKNKQTQKQKVIQLGNIYQSVMAYWKEIMDLKNLRSLLLEDNNEEKLAQFIRDHYSKSENNTQRLKGILNQFTAIKNSFSLKQPEKIKSQIAGLLEEMNFFNGNNPSPLRAIDQSDNRDALLRKQQELDACLNQNRKTEQKLLEQEQIIQELLGEQEINSQEINSQEIINLKHENTLLKQRIVIFIILKIHFLDWTVVFQENMERNVIIGQSSNQQKSPQLINPPQLIIQVNIQQQFNKRN